MTALTAAAAARDGNDPIFALHGEATRRAKAGEDILNATLGALVHDDGSLAVMPSSAEAFARIPMEQSAGYAPISGRPEFLQAVIRDVFGDSGLGSQAVAVATPGCSGAVHSAFQSFLEPGQAALTTDHFWGSYRGIASFTGRDLATFNMFDDDLAFDVAAFERRVADLIDRQGRALVILNFPCHNPTGYSLDDGEWDAVSAIVRDAGARAPVSVFIDYAYAAFAPESREWVEYAPRMLETATLLVGWTVSKSFAQYGSRVGALVAAHRDEAERAQLASSLGFSCRSTWSNCNHAGQLAITELLTDPELSVQAIAERQGLIELLGERVGAFNAAARAAGLTYARYDGGFFVTVLTSDPQAVAARMRENGVYVVPMNGAVRLALCATPVTSIQRLVDSLSEAVS